MLPSVSGDLRNVRYLSSDSDKLSNQAVACFNLAYCFLKVNKEGDTIDMMKQLSELETYLTPDMSVYSSLIDTGFSYLLFGTYPDFLRDITLIEEFIQNSVNGPTQNKMNNYSKKNLMIDEDLKVAIQRTEFIQQAYTHVKMKQLADKLVKGYDQLPIINHTNKPKDLRKIILSNSEHLELAQEHKTGEKDAYLKGKTRGDTILSKREEQEDGAKKAKKDSNFALLLKRSELSQENFSNLDEIALASRNLQPASDLIHNSDPAVVNTPPAEGIKIIEIDDLIDSPDKSPDTMPSHAKFAFRSMRTDGSQIVIKNSVTGADARNMFKVLVINI